jgi:CHAD domain-containing protein
MAEFSGDALERHGEKLARALEALDEASDGDGAGPAPDALHTARIAAKRLRYIAEQLAGPKAAALVERLTALQDALGEHRDSRLLAERALAEIGRSARSDARARARALLAGTNDHPPEGRPARSRVRPGLLQVARAAEARADEMLRKFETEWPRESRAERLRAEVRELAADLASNR